MPLTCDQVAAFAVFHFCSDCTGAKLGSTRDFTFEVRGTDLYFQQFRELGDVMLRGLEFSIPITKGLTGDQIAKTCQMVHTRLRQVPAAASEPAWDWA